MFKLYPYQKKTRKKIVKRLEKHGRCYLSAEERFGKNVTSMSALDQVGAQKVLYVTVKNAIKGIISDYSLGNFNFKIKVINYESLDKITDLDFDAIVLDESTKLAAFPKATINTRKAFQKISICQPKYVMWLNATPAVESYSQFYHQLKVGGFWSKYKTFYEWFRDYGIPSTMRIAGGREIQSYKKTHEALVLKAINKIMVTGTREEAGFEFTDAVFNMHEVPMNDQNLSVYKEIEQHGIYGDLILADTAVKKMSKLQQLTGGFMYDDDGSAFEFNRTKQKYLYEHARGKKVAVYAKYTWEVNELRAVLGECKDPFDFKHNGGQFLVMQIKSGSKGIDLSFCDQHWFYSLDFSGETFIQAIARQHNKKRDRPVEVEILHTGLIDKDIFDAVSHKKDFNTKLYRSLK